MHSQYRTPKRRHSSLFHRMEEEIQKISRKLSAAKTSARQSSYQKIKSVRKDTQSVGKQKVKQNVFETMNKKSYRRNIHFDEGVQSSVIQTVRIKHMPGQKIDYSPISGQKTVNSKTLNRRINFASFRQNQEDRMSKLQKQNEQLSFQISKLQQVCQDQSYRMGYASAYFEDKYRRLQQQSQEYRKENIYLKKLCEHYKLKSRDSKSRKYSIKHDTQSSCISNSEK